MPELDRLSPSPALDQVRVRLEEAEHALRGGHGLVLKLRPNGVPMNGAHRGQVVRQPTRQGLQLETRAPRGTFHESRRLLDDPSRSLDQQAKVLLHRPLPFGRRALTV